MIIFLSAMAGVNVIRHSMPEAPDFCALREARECRDFAHENDITPYDTIAKR